MKQILQNLILGITALMLVACGTVEETIMNAEPVSQKEANKKLVAEYIENLGVPGIVPFIEAHYAEDFERTRHEFENLVFNADDPVLSEISEGMSVALPDRKNTVTRLLGENDLVAATYRISGTHSGNLYGIPATGKSIDIEAITVVRVDNGKIAEGWHMADEAALLRQLGAKLPARQDGKLNIPPKIGEIRTYDEALAEHTANPKDTREYRQTRLLLAYKSKPENRPADYKFEGRPYTTYVRSGIVNIVERGAELGVEGGHRESLSERQDMIHLTVSDGDHSMMLFRLTAQNTGPLYGIPAGGGPLDDWEAGFARFEGDTWVDGYWFKDELGYLLAIGNEEALNFLVSD